MTRSIPILNTTSPPNVPIRTFLNNVAHSNRGPGLRTYPHGFRPRSQSNTLSSTPSVSEEGEESEWVTEQVISVCRHVICQGKGGK